MQNYEHPEDSWTFTARLHHNQYHLGQAKKSINCEGEEEDYWPGERCLIMQFCTYTRLVVIAQQIRKISPVIVLPWLVMTLPSFLSSRRFFLRTNKGWWHDHGQCSAKRGQPASLVMELCRRAKEEEAMPGNSKGIEVGGTFLVVPFHLFSAIPPFFATPEHRRLHSSLGTCLINKYNLDMMIVSVHTQQNTCAQAFGFGRRLVRAH